MSSEIDPKLRSEIINLFQYVQRLRKEIASITKRDDEQTTFQSMSDQLGAIVNATENATDTILQAMESVGGLLEEIRNTDETKKRNSLRFT